MSRIKDLNAHEAPPEAIRLRYKHYHKASLPDINADPAIVDLQALNVDNLPDGISLLRQIRIDDLQPAFTKFFEQSTRADEPLQQSIPVYTHQYVTGNYTRNGID
jgi:hypothetical protein